MTTIMIRSQNRCWARGATVAEAAKRLLTLTGARAVRVQVTVFAGPDEPGLHERVTIHGIDGTMSYPEALELVTQFTVSKLSALLA
jgi:hypothetical protein